MSLNERHDVCSYIIFCKLPSLSLHKIKMLGYLNLRRLARQSVTNHKIIFQRVVSYFVLSMARSPSGYFSLD